MCVQIPLQPAGRVVTGLLSLTALSETGQESERERERESTATCLLTWSQNSDGELKCQM